MRAVIPACERLHADDTTARDFDLRLETDVDLAPIDRMVKIDREIVERRDALRLRDADHRAVTPFGGSERLAGLAQQRGGIVAGQGFGEADPAADECAHRSDDEGLCQPFGQPTKRRLHVIDAVGDRQREFYPPEMRADRVLVVGDVGDRSFRGGDQRIAGRPTISGVDDVDARQCDQHERDGFARVDPGRQHGTNRRQRGIVGPSGQVRAAFDHPRES